MRRFLAPVLTDHAARGVIAIETAVLIMRATGTTPGSSRSVLNEGLPDAQAANNNPNVTE
jgi:hypothetical protein